METDYDKTNAVLRRILENAGKKFDCPLQAENIKSDVEHGMMQNFQDSMSEFHRLLAIAEESGIVFVCPQCLDADFEYFDKMNQFQFHCWKKEMKDTWASSPSINRYSTKLTVKLWEAIFKPHNLASVRN
jgi:hypothetical protein